MAVIDYEAVKTSVGEVYKAGKEFPQKEIFFSVPQDKRAAKAAEIMQDTINAIANHFLPQKISVSLWQKATQIAKVSAEKMITPKLFHDAILVYGWPKPSATPSLKQRNYIVPRHF